jgi:hypothetical protein
MKTQSSFVYATTKALMAAWLLGVALSGSAQAMTEIEEHDLGAFTGEGLAFALEDIRFQMAPTSYIQQTGSDPKAGTSFVRGDLRWYGLAISNATASGVGWTGEACSSGLSCPMSMSAVTDLAAHDNPYVMRVFDYTAYNYQNVSSTRTVLELLGPSQTDKYRWAFWGEVYVNPSSGTCSTNASSPNCFLQSQTIINGSPTAPAQTGGATLGSVLRLFQTDNSADNTLGLIYHSRLSGDFRFSLSQAAGSPNTRESVPLFANGASDAAAPGLKFRNVSAYLPLGQLHYQSVTLDDINSGGSGVAGNGNFVIELTQIPAQSNAYGDFYSLNTTCAASTGTTGENCGYNRTRPARYYETHGYVQWGSITAGSGNNTATAATNRANTTDGVMFTAASGTTFTATANRPAINPGGTPGAATTYSAAGISHVNLGDSYIEGMLIQHLKITSLGAGP